VELAIVIAFVLGLIFGRVLPRKAVGVLKIDHTNPNKDVYRFEIDDFDKLNKKRRILLAVDHNANLSHK